MPRIPVIAAFGGVNAAGRTSGHHGYRRMVIDALSPALADETWRSLSSLMGVEGELNADKRAYLADHTLIRTIEKGFFDYRSVSWNRKVPMTPADGPVQFDITKRNLPDVLPKGWAVEVLDDKNVRVTMSASSDMYVTDRRRMDVSAAGQLPTGFDPQALYPARSHPRGLQLSVYGASDMLGNLGISWEDIAARLPGDQVSVYAGSAISQLDEFGNGGLLNSRAQGKRVSSKHLAMGLAEMPADFVNAYVLGNIGTTGNNLGACATFLYNLRQGVQDIRDGRARVAIIGAAEAPLVAEVMDGFNTMGALGTDQNLLDLDKAKGRSEPDVRRACRPFGDNCGFTLAEGAQFITLMDDELALEMGAQIHGVVPDVFVNADGNKKSISAPGVGNFVTFAKSVGLAREILGEQAIRQRSFIQAHGTGTPQNRVSESRIFNDTAKAFGIESWPVAAIKCFIGHSMAAASGDQLVNCLGVWEHGIIPGIATIDGAADDVHDSNLSITNQHTECGKDAMDVAFLNSKGFGGNNATAPVLAPHIAEQLLAKKHGQAAMHAWQDKREATLARSAEYEQAVCAGQTEVVYRFDHNVRGDDDVSVTASSLKIKGYDQPIDLAVENPLGVSL